MSAELGAPPADGALHLDRLADHHRDRLRALCAEDAAIWEIYPVDFGPAGFDAAFDMMLARPDRIIFAIHNNGVLVGMTGYILTMLAYQTVEIGNTYLRPAVRGTGLNGRLKRLMIDHAFASGIRRVELRADRRNARSCAAIVKAGGVLDGILRQERVTWTGHVRDTCVYSVLASEWQSPSTAG